MSRIMYMKAVATDDVPNSGLSNRISETPTDLLSGLFLCFLRFNFTVRRRGVLGDFSDKDDTHFSVCFFIFSYQNLI